MAASNNRHVVPNPKGEWDGLIWPRGDGADSGGRGYT